MTTNWFFQTAAQQTIGEPSTVAQVYEALGRFAALFSGTEFLLQYTLWYVTGVSNPVAKAVFDGFKTEQLMQKIRRVLEVSEIPASTRDLYQEVFTHIGYINDARNLLLHHGVSSEDDKFVSTNSWLALTESRIKRMPVSVEVLGNLASDTIKVNALLQINTIRDESVRSGIENLSREDWQRPWLYEPPQSSSRPKQPRSR